MKGKVHLSLRQETSIKTITVKMEGVAKTVVPIARPDDEGSRRSRESKHDAIEIHKVLYHTVTVFPPPEIEATSTSNQYTLKPGDYSYDFTFRIPLKTECRNAASSIGNNQARGILGDTKLVVNSGSIDYARAATSHVDSVLPPSFSGLGELASVKYFFKATVNRASMFKINARNTNPFVFLPIDPKNSEPQPQQQKQAFVRRELGVKVPNTISSYQEPPQQEQQQKGGFWRNVSRAMGVNTSYNTGAGNKFSRFYFEARFPQDGGLTPMSPLPIKLFVLFMIQPDQLNFSTLYMGDFTMVLYANTEVKAQTSNKQSNLQLRLDTDNSSKLSIPVSKAVVSNARHASGSQLWEVEVDPSVLRSVTIPDYVPPTFTTCNIRRTYALEINAGFSTSPSMSFEYVSLLMDPVIRSGINPRAPQKSEQEQYPPPPPSKSSQPEQQQEAAMSKYNEAHANVAPDENQGLPSYEQVLAEGPTETSYNSAPAAPEDPTLRRKFGQSNDYYQNIDEND